MGPGKQDHKTTKILPAEGADCVDIFEVMVICVDTGREIPVRKQAQSHPCGKGLLGRG